MKKTILITLLAFVLSACGGAAATPAPTRTPWPTMIKRIIITVPVATAIPTSTLEPGKAPPKPYPVQVMELPKNSWDKRDVHFFIFVWVTKLNEWWYWGGSDYRLTYKPGEIPQFGFRIGLKEGETDVRLTEDNMYPIVRWFGANVMDDEGKIKQFVETFLLDPSPFSFDEVIQLSYDDTVCKSKLYSDSTCCSGHGVLRINCWNP
jgi:hypothetical protein